MRSAQIVEIGPASTGITTSAPFFLHPRQLLLIRWPVTKMTFRLGVDKQRIADEQNEKARQDWEGAGRPGDRYAGLPTP